jgi:hypothetical protein
MSKQFRMLFIMSHLAACKIWEFLEHVTHPFLISKFELVWIIREKYQNRWAHPSASRSEPWTDRVGTAETTPGCGRVPHPWLPTVVSLPRFCRRAALRPSPLPTIKGARPREGPFLLPPPSTPHCAAVMPLWNHRAAPPRRLRIPSRPVPKLRCSARSSPTQSPASSLNRISLYHIYFMPQLCTYI